MSKSETLDAKETDDKQALQEENDFLKDQVKFYRNSGLFTALTNIISKSVPWIGIVACIYLVVSGGVDVVESLAGQETNASIDVKTDFRGGLDLAAKKAEELSDAASGFTFLQLIYASLPGWIFGGIGIMFGLKHRNLRKIAIERMSSRMEEYELRVDPGRTSSGLDRTGDTHKKDK